jgi:hypothetical protein
MIIMLMNEYEMMVHFIALPKMMMTITKWNVQWLLIFRFIFTPIFYFISRVPLQNNYSLVELVDAL